MKACGQMTLNIGGDKVPCCCCLEQQSGRCCPNDPLIDSYSEQLVYNWSYPSYHRDRDRYVSQATAELDHTTHCTSLSLSLQL